MEKNWFRSFMGMRKLVETGICHCGQGMHDHNLYDTHQQLEMLMEETRWYDPYFARWHWFWFRLR